MSPSPYLSMLQFRQIKVKLQCNGNDYLKQINLKKDYILENLLFKFLIKLFYNANEVQIIEKSVDIV